MRTHLSAWANGFATGGGTARVEEVDRTLTRELNEINDHGCDPTGSLKLTHYRPGRPRLHWPIVTAGALTVSTAEDPNASILESTQIELREPTGARASQGWLGERPAGVLAR
jgi:hypothetical protein